MRSLIIVVLMASCAVTPALSQGTDIDRRVDRVESEIRALQRQVFPGGDPDFFQPEIQSGTQDGVAGNPTSSPITALTDRVNALERQLATLTGQVEENSFELRQLRAMVEGLQIATPIEPETDIPAEATPADQVAEPTTEEAPETAPPPSETSSEPPLPNDAGEASYVRGYRLWRDGNFADARTQLQETVENFPGHRFESYARNLLGRAYLDDEKPANATEIFVRNYQELPDGDRAADSLFFLGVALTELNYNDRACLAFDELEDVYGNSLRSVISEQLPAARSAADCN